MTTSPSSAPLRTNRFGLPVVLLLGLALLASVRGVLHDLHLVPSENPITWVLALVPLAVWVTVAVLWSRRPFVSLLVAGAIHGVLLGVTHVVLWDVNLAASGLDQPALGGNLAGVLPPVVEAVLLRGATFLSSLLVGLVLGAVAGLIAAAIRRIPALRSHRRSAGIGHSTGGRPLEAWDSSRDLLQNEPGGAPRQGGAPED